MIFSAVENGVTAHSGEAKKTLAERAKKGEILVQF